MWGAWVSRHPLRELPDCYRALIADPIVALEKPEAG